MLTWYTVYHSSHNLFTAVKYKQSPWSKKNETNIISFSKENTQILIAWYVKKFVCVTFLKVHLLLKKEADIFDIFSSSFFLIREH